MRMIKFRTWNKINKIIEPFYLGEDYAEGWEKRLILMQFTGLKDKNGKEIYEGDKLIHSQYPTPLVVQWDYDQWGLFDGMCNEASIDENVKIVGNIYEK